MPFRRSRQNADANIDFSSLYLKRVLLPFWVVRKFLMVFYGIIYIVAIIALSQVGTNSFSDSRSDIDDGARHGAIALAAVILVICLVTLALDLYTVVLFVRRRLHPKTLLIVNCVQTAFWLVLFGLQIWGSVAAGKAGRTASAISWLISLILLLAFVGLLIYAAVVFHRYRKRAARGQYVSAVDDLSSLPPTLASGTQDTPMQTHYPGGGAHEFYRPNMRQPAPRQQADLTGDLGDGQQQQQYRSRDFTAATDGLNVNYPGGFYAAAPAASSTAKLAQVAEQPIELSGRPFGENR